MDNIDNSTNLTENASEPEGLHLLRTNHLTEDEAIKQLTRCCNEHPFGCGCEAQCLQRFDIRTETWKLRPYYEYKPKLLTSEQKYANSLPRLSRSAVINLVRERAIY